MKELINNAKRRLGVPGRRSLVLDPGERVQVSDGDYEDLIRNRTTARWLERGVLSVVSGDGEPVEAPAPKPQPPRPGVKKRDTDVREPQVLPDGLAGEGVELNHIGGGWYEVYVNGFKVTDENVRKDRAEEIAGEYQQ